MFSPTPTTSQSTTGNRAASRYRQPMVSNHPLQRAMSAREVQAYGFATSPAGLSHVDPQTGLPTMVDVSVKQSVSRTAIARSVLLLPAAVMSSLDSDSGEFYAKKGPVLSTATVAGTMAVKGTSSIIPFCHPLPIDKIHFTAQLYSHSRSSAAEWSTYSHYTKTSSAADADKCGVLVIECLVGCTAKTGVEMEALMGVSVYALTVYDMCKALSHDIVILDTQLIRKEGGKSGLTNRDTRTK